MIISNKISIRAVCSVFAIQVSAFGFMISNVQATDILEEIMKAKGFTAKQANFAVKGVNGAQEKVSSEEFASRVQALKTAEQTVQGSGDQVVDYLKVKPHKTIKKAVEKATAGVVNNDAAVQRLNAVGLDVRDINLIAAARRLITLNERAASADQIQGTSAFILGGRADPELADIDGWVNNQPTRAERVLIAAVGEDSTDPDLIAAAAKAVEKNIQNPTLEELQGAVHLMTVLNEGDPSENRIKGAAAFITGGRADPTLADIDGWVNNQPTRAERILIAAANLDSTNPDLIAGVRRLGVLGQNNPSADQMQGAAAFIAGGRADPELADIDGWVNNQPTRAVRVLIAAVGEDSTDPDLIAAAAKAVEKNIQNPTLEELQGAVHLMTTLNKGNPSENRIKGAAAFITGGRADPTLADIDGWVADQPTRAVRILIAAENLDSTDLDLIAGVRRLGVLGQNNPSADQMRGAAAFIAGGRADPELADINGWVNNQATRAERVLIAAAGEDSTDNDLIVATTVLMHLNEPNITADKIFNADYILRILNVDRQHLTLVQVEASEAFDDKGLRDDLTLNQINHWVVVGAQDRPRIVRAVKAFVDGGVKDASTNEIDHWLGLQQGKRAAFVKAVKRGNRM